MKNEYRENRCYEDRPTDFVAGIIWDWFSTLGPRLDSLRREDGIWDGYYSGGTQVTYQECYEDDPGPRATGWGMSYRFINTGETL